MGDGGRPIDVNAAPGTPGAQRADQHILVQQAERDARGHTEAWRMHYGLPLTDPRYLDADEDTILRDLLRIRAHHQLTTVEDGQAQADRMAAEPGITGRMATRKLAAMADPTFIKGLAALGVKIGPAKTEPKPTKKTINFRRPGGKPPVKP